MPGPGPGRRGFGRPVEELDRPDRPVPQTQFRALPPTAPDTPPSPVADSGTTTDAAPAALAPEGDGSEPTPRASGAAPSATAAAQSGGHPASDAARQDAAAPFAGTRAGSRHPARRSRAPVVADRTSAPAPAEDHRTGAIEDAGGDALRARAMREAKAAQIAVLLSDRLGLRGTDLPAIAPRARRRLPRRRARQLDNVLAGIGAGSPDAAPEPDRFDRDYRRLHAYLDRLDPRRHRARRRANLVAAIAFQMLVVVGLLLAVLRWRGFV